MTQPESSYGYVDTRYLNITAEQLRFFKITSYDRMQIQSGHTVLDLGCGPASDTLALAKLVGETGKVVGVDYDSEMIATARQKAEDAGVSHYVNHELHDATHLPYPDNTFDSCRSERVFQHLEAPEQALTELVRVTKPNGWIVIADADWASMAYFSRLPELEWKLRTTAAYKSSLYPIMGRQAHYMMRQAHLESINATALTLNFRDYQTASYVLLLDAKLKRGVEGGYLTQDEADRLLEDLKQLDADGDFFAYICGVVAAGQKPA